MNSHQQPHYPAQGVALGPLVMLQTTSRNGAWDLDAATGTTWTVAWTRAAIAPYVPVGVRALYLKALITHDDNANRVVRLRKQGSTAADNQQNTSVWLHAGTGGAVAHTEHLTCLCDREGIIEYSWNAAATSRLFYLHIEGYYL